MRSETPDAIIERHDHPKAYFPLMKDMWVERGTAADWELLHELHYKAEGRPMGPRYWRLALHGETIGVIVTASPKLLLKERHIVFPRLKPGHDSKFTNTHRAVWINENMRVISRFVVDTMYRGIGVSYRFQNLASRMEGFRFMEIQSSMSKFNSFGQGAGFRFVRPTQSNKYEVGLKFFRLNFISNPADHEAIMLEIAAMHPNHRERTIAAMRDFYWANSAMEKTGSNSKVTKETSRVQVMLVPALLRQIQQMVLASPMYGVFRNPDCTRILPERLPLLAFDRQGVTEELKLD